MLALALFVGAATIISSGINASVQAVYRLRLETHAANLAISVLAEMQMRARPIATFGPELFEAPFTNWNYRVELTQSEAVLNDELRPVEVIVSHVAEPIVYRLTQLFRASEIAASETNGVETLEYGGAL